MKLLEVNWLRFIAIISILVWHCFCCPIQCWNLLEPSFTTKLVTRISSFLIPGANMPLFTCLSGYLFAHLYYNKKKSYTSFTSILRNKFHRLVVPFFIIGTIGTLSVPERHWTGIFWGDGSSMWFCAMLFWCTMLRWIVLNYNNYWISYSILGLCIVYYFIKAHYGLPHSFHGIPIGLFCFNRAFYYYPFFVLGDVLYKYRDIIIKSKNKTWIILFICFLIVGNLQYLNHEIIAYGSMKFMPVCLILLLFVITIKLTNNRIVFGSRNSSHKSKTLISESSSKNLIISNRHVRGGTSCSSSDAYNLDIGNYQNGIQERLGRFVDQFCIHSFGIYAIHEEISWNSYHTQPLFDIFKEFPIIYATIFTIIVTIICYIITHFALKTKIGKYLLS